jgi:hypothetical protein
MLAGSAALAVSLVLVPASSSAHEPVADPAAPLPAKDIRWAATLGGAADVGSMPRASAGLALGFDVRRGALAARAISSVFAPQIEHTTGASVALFDLMAMVCALAPVSSWLDAGACGGGGFGLLRAGPLPGAVGAAGLALRPEGLGTARFDFVLSNAFVISLETGTVLDPLRTMLPIAGAGDAGRSSLLSFRGVLGIYVRVW